MSLWQELHLCSSIEKRVEKTISRNYNLKKKPNRTTSQICIKLRLFLTIIIIRMYKCTKCLMHLLYTVRWSMPTDTVRMYICIYILTYCIISFTSVYRIYLNMNNVVRWWLQRNRSTVNMNEIFPNKIGFIDWGTEEQYMYVQSKYLISEILFIYAFEMVWRA